MQKKVLFTASTYSHIVNFHIPYLEWFHSEGWIVHVGCGGTAKKILCADQVLHLPFEKKMHAPSNLRAASMLRHIISEQRYDLVIAHTSLAAFFTRLALKGLKRRPRVINVAHGYLFGGGGQGGMKDKILIAAEKIVSKETDLVLTMNNWDYEAAKKYALAPEIYNIPGIGVDFEKRCAAAPATRESLRRKRSIPENAFVLFFAAEFSSRKNQAMLIRGMQYLPDQVVLVLAGLGEQFESCKELAKSLNLEKRVIFPGYVSDVASWYAASDAAVSSSRSEGLPFNVMEAMYCGLPVVASSVKGHMDLIEDGKTGLLFAYDNETEFASQIKKLARSEALCSELGVNASKSVLKYDINHVRTIVVERYVLLLSTDTFSKRKMNY